MKIDDLLAPHPDPLPVDTGRGSVFETAFYSYSVILGVLGGSIMVFVFLGVLAVNFCFSFVSILTPDPSPPVERGDSRFPFSAREKGKG